MEEMEVDKAILDFQNVQFFAVNLFAVLGCCLTENYIRGINTKCVSIQPSIIRAMSKSKFGKNFNIPCIEDIYHNSVEYRRFSATEIEQFEKYITIELLSRNDLPDMSDGVKDNINDYLLEIFNNVTAHTDSRYVYTCGQFFPKSKLLYFTVANYGKEMK